MPSNYAGYTNWDDALEKVRTVNTSAGGVAPLVLFVTDGEPTAYNNAPGNNSSVTTGTGATTLRNAYWTGKYEANLVKGQGSHILVVGVGDAAGNQAKMEGISGPDVYDGTPPPDLDIKTTDVVLVTNFSDLEAQIRQVALELCANSVTITKYTDSGGPNGNLQPAPGWTFYGKVGSPPPAGTAYTWTVPSGVAGTEVFSQTGANGAVTFQWKPFVVTASSLVTITEQSQANFEFVAIRCQQKTSVGGVQTTRTFTPTTSTSDPRGPSWSFPISPTVNFPILTCSVVNDDITLVRLKSFTGQVSADDVTLAWETDFELDNAGFNIYRSTSEGGDKVKLNGQLIGAMGSGATYQYVDADVGDGTYYYWLEDVDTAGLATVHGPVAIAAGDAAADVVDRLWLPIIIGGN